MSNSVYSVYKKKIGLSIIIYLLSSLPGIILYKPYIISSFDLTTFHALVYCVFLQNLSLQPLLTEMGLEVKVAKI